MCLSTAAAATSADTRALANDPYWHLLLRYEPTKTASGWRSEARSHHFFLAANGRDDPQAELDSLIAALQTPSIADNDAACRFPARTAWLASKTPLVTARAKCPALDEWRQLVNPEQATLVFASDYLNNPSSMFGHTFLRLDAAGQTEDTRLLAYAVNYAANADAKNPFAFAWKGLTGGYPGLFSLLPYYDKVKEYSDMENRDLWEYQLNFTPAEVELMLLHLWELRDVEFPYYFLTRNCSFQILALFEVARPGLALRADFPVQAIPTDTLRRVLAEDGMLRQRIYRPAAERRLLLAARAYPDQVLDAAKLLADAPDTQISLPPTEMAAALETAYDYRYYRFLAGDNPAGSSHDMLTLLRLRAPLDVPEQRQKPVEPTVDPSAGHATARIAISTGYARETGQLNLRFRPAYHDLLDPPQGYRHGAHIDFLDTELRLEARDNHLVLERLAIVDIDSLTPYDRFFQPVSWSFGFGWRQAAINGSGQPDDRDHHGVAYMDGGAGISLRLANDLECYVQLGGDIEGGKALDAGWRTGIGPRAGCIGGGSRWRFRSQADHRWRNSPSFVETRALLEAQLDIAPGHGLRLQGSLLHTPGLMQPAIEAGWTHYF
ncbi:MAG: DUF4105 domain-containing protein [Moraxellaceae bacterium]|nr:DUF4105 domain-containing protein [Moraxellaceae bacterium]